MKLRFTPQALVELDEILGYLFVHSPSGADRVAERLRASFDVLARSPQIVRRTSNARLRRLTATPYPYLIFYEVRRDDIVVIAVRYAARDPGSMPAF